MKMVGNRLKIIIQQTGVYQLEFSRDSDIVNFIINYLVAEFLFFVGTSIIIVFKVLFNLDVGELLQGTFIGSTVTGLFTEAFSQEQIAWIFNNLLLWWINVFLALFSSLLLISGFFALAILLPLGVDVFSGSNAIAAEAMPVGILFLLCWGILPLMYIVRSSWINWFQKLKTKISPAPV